MACATELARPYRPHVSRAIPSREKAATAAATEPIHPARNPYLNGVFAPVDDGIDVADLPVIEKIPEDLRGADLRNGPNVKFPPLQLWIPLTRE